MGLAAVPDSGAIVARENHTHISFYYFSLFVILAQKLASFSPSRGAIDMSTPYRFVDTKNSTLSTYRQIMGYRHFFYRQIVNYLGWKYFRKSCPQFDIINQFKSLYFQKSS